MQWFIVATLLALRIHAHGGNDVVPGHDDAIDINATKSLWPKSRLINCAKACALCLTN